MSSKGWVSIHRQFLTSKLWLSEPFTRGQAWVDLVGLANHKDGWIRVRGIKFIVKRGQCGWSQVKLAKRWRWSRGKVRRFFKELENDERILLKTVQQNMKLTSLINIINYDKYQTGSTSSGTTNGHQTDIKRYSNNNDNNDNNDNNISLPSDKDTSIRNFCLSFIEYIQKTKSKKAPRSKNTFKNSYVVVNQLINIDGYNLEFIIKTMRWALKDDFWQDNVFSLAALRKKSDNQLMKFQNIVNSMDKENKKISNTKGKKAGRSFIEKMRAQR